MTIMEELGDSERVAATSPTGKGKTKLLVKDFNQQITCSLCGGYFIDATTVMECLHTFCRTCIVSYLELSEYCPVCDATVHASKPLLGIRQDRLLQDLVYKLVPGLFTSEMERKKDFYSKNPRHFALDSTEPSTEEQHTDLILDNEQISLSLEFQDRLSYREKEPAEPESRETVLEKRYLLCPAQLTIQVLERFIRAKFDIPTTYQVELFHTSESLPGHYTMRDLAYIYSWQKTAPFKLFFTAFEVLHKETSQDNSCSDTPVLTSDNTSTSRLRVRPCKHLFGSDVESTDSDCSDATYQPPVVQIKQEPDTFRQQRRRPYKRRGTTRLMFSQRGWDSLGKKQKRQPTGRPRGRPRKHINLFTSRDTFHFNVLPAAQVVKRPRGWPKGKPRKRKVMDNNASESASKPTAPPIKRMRGRPRKVFQPKYCSTPNPVQLSRNVKPVLSAEKSHVQEHVQELCGLQGDGHTDCHLSNIEDYPSSSSKRRICSLPECTQSPTEATLPESEAHDSQTMVDSDEAVTSFSRNVGRVHWIYRKRKMPIPSIPVSLKLNQNEISELVRNNRSGDSYLSPSARGRLDSASCSSDDNCPNLPTGSFPDIPTTRTASQVGNLTQTDSASVPSRSMYSDPAGPSPYFKPHALPCESRVNCKPVSMQSKTRLRPVPQNNDTMYYSQVSIKDINRRMAEIQTSSHRNYDNFTAMNAQQTTQLESDTARSQALMQRDPGLNDPCEAVLRSMSKHRLLYLLKRCTEQPSHSLHESTLLGQRRSKEGDSLEEDSLEEKPASPIVERFRPLNINLQ